MTTRLFYAGGGALYHVPARDLTDEDFAERAELWKENGITEAVLLNSGLYKRADEPAGQTKKTKRGASTAAEEGE